jgi:hypothetical protein
MFHADVLWKGEHFARAISEGDAVAMLESPILVDLAPGDIDALNRGR